MAKEIKPFMAKKGEVKSSAKSTKGMMPKGVPGRLPQSAPKFKKGGMVRGKNC